MSARDAVEALRELGLSNYEAQVFVALQRLGTGTAQEVSQLSDVPRSQVYGAADDLAARGLVEVVESSPKEFRPVSLETARDQLRRRIERQHERAFENLEAVHGEQADHAEGTVATVHGRGPIVARMGDLVAGASDLVVLVGVTDDLVSDDLAAAFRDRAAAGVDVLLVTDDERVEARFADSPVRVIHSEASGESGYAGRTLLVDDATVLLSVPTEEDSPEPFDETALWTAETNIGRILARFVHAGMESGLDESYPAPEDSA